MVSSWPWVTHRELHAWLLQIGAKMSKIEDYAQSVDAETNRIADVVAGLQAQVADQDAALASAFDPVVEHLRGVGVSGPTAPPTNGGEPPLNENPGNA